eukprot:6222-Pelagococcus_subviridis.AAC.2
MNEVYAACYFNTAKVGRNPELFMAYRVVSTPTVAGINFGDRGNGNASTRAGGAAAKGWITNYNIT